MSDVWYQQLTDKMVRRFNLSQRLLFNTSTKKEIIFRPIITISRDPGSGGAPIGKLVAKALKFKYYDHRLIDEIAASAKLRKNILKNIDERTRSAMEDFVHGLLNPDYIPEEKYINHLCKVMLTLAQKGKAVIIGRGGNFITPRAFGLHVRITAPYRVCVARAVQHEKLTHAKAREVIHKVMAERAGFIKQYFGRDIGNAKYYDLTLNTTYMTMPEAADLIIRAFKKKFP